MKTPEEKKAYHRQYYLAHKDALKASSIKYYAEHKDEIKTKTHIAYPAKCAEAKLRAQQWSKDNPGKVAARAVKWQAENKARRAVIRKRWWDKNHEKARGYARKRRDQRKAVGEVKHTLVGILAATIYMQFDNTCVKCGGAEHLSLDHHMPLSAGYPLELGNAVILCRSCNSSKGNKFPEDFYAFSELRAIEALLRLQKEMV